MRFVATFTLLAAVTMAPIGAVPIPQSTNSDKPNCTQDWTNGCIAAVVAGSVGGAAVVGGATGLTVHAIKKAREQKPFEDLHDNTQMTGWRIATQPPIDVVGAGQPFVVDRAHEQVPEGAGALHQSGSDYEPWSDDEEQVDHPQERGLHESMDSFGPPHSSTDSSISLASSAREEASGLSRDVSELTRSAFLDSNVHV
ncbi:hypothetical protein FRB96_007533 [Tulasnella sp. 330]|nr:hypothetical protein FRB96_007533 [Tulasnella sp. 330]